MNFTVCQRVRAFTDDALSVLEEMRGRKRSSEETNAPEMMDDIHLAPPAAASSSTKRRFLEGDGTPLFALTKEQLLDQWDLHAGHDGKRVDWYLPMPGSPPVITLALSDIITKSDKNIDLREHYESRQLHATLACGRRDVEKTTVPEARVLNSAKIDLGDGEIYGMHEQVQPLLSAEPIHQKLQKDVNVNHIEELIKLFFDHWGADVLFFHPIPEAAQVRIDPFDGRGSCGIVGLREGYRGAG
jgi:hypothetical protein